VLRLRGNLQQYVPTPAPTPRFVSQSLDALLQKSLRPFVDIATVEPDHGSNVGDRDPIGEEEDNPGTSEQPDTDGRRPLPREERPAFRRREGDDEGGFASTSHTAPLSHTGEARYTMGSRYSLGIMCRKEDRDAIALHRLPAYDGRRCLAHAGVVKIMLPVVRLYTCASA
jgi:hypothetical protein